MMGVMHCKLAHVLFQIQSLTQKIWEMKGSMKRTQLKRVKKSADAMFGSLTESKMSSKADFKANLKTVKKEEEKVYRYNNVYHVINDTSAF